MKPISKKKGDSPYKERKQKRSISPKSKTTRSPGKQNQGSISPKKTFDQGYLNSLKEQENNLISEHALNEGERFEDDIKNIENIIKSVEMQNAPDKLLGQFKKNNQVSYNRRKMEMTRTIMAQTAHQ